MKIKKAISNMVKKDQEKADWRLLWNVIAKIQNLEQQRINILIRLTK